MDIWEQNLEVLRRTSPELAEAVSAVPPSGQIEVATAKNGQPVLRVRGNALHSLYNPTREGEGWAQSLEEESRGKPVVVFGLGLGYHILPLLARGREVTVVEPSVEVIRRALELVDLRPLLARRGLVAQLDALELPETAHLAIHRPTARLHRLACERLQQRLAAPAAGPPPRTPVAGAPPGRRILVISPLYGGTYPIAQYCTRAFQRLGHQARMLDHAPFYPAYTAMDEITQRPEANAGLKRGLLGLVAEGVRIAVAEFDPELVWILPFAPLDGPLIQELRGQGRKVAYWFVEDFRVFGFWREVAPVVDRFFVIQEEPLTAELRKMGVKPVFLPLAADPELFRPLALSDAEQQEYGSPVSFVGAGYVNRRHVFAALSDFDFKIWGSDWDLEGPLQPLIQRRGARIPPAETVKIFNASQINLNLHSSPFHQGINPQGDYVNPRVFDLAAAGAFQLVDERLHLPRFFQPGTEMAVFRNVQELREMIRHYLAHPEERRRLAARARQRVLAEHTYEHRMAQALRQIFEATPARRSREAAAGLECRPAPGGEDSLEAWLAQVPPEHRGSLESLVAYIEAGQGDLSQPEAILMFLQEFHQGLQRGRL